MNRIDGGIGRRLECAQTEATARRIEHAKRRIISVHECNRAFQDEGRNLAKIRTRIQRIRDRQQRALRFCLAFLVGVETRVLITDRDLPRDRLQKDDFIIEPLTWRARRVQTNQAENIFAKHHRYHEQRARAETGGEVSHLLIETGRGDVVQANRFSEIDVFLELFEFERDDGAETRRYVI